MDLFGGIGKSLENFADQAKDMTQKVNIGAKNASKNTKIKFQIKEEEAQLEEYYKELGEIYYMEMREQGHRTEKTSGEMLLLIDGAIEEIERLGNLLMYREIDYDDDLLRCSKCGQVVNEEDKFCSQCGAPIEIDDKVVVYEDKKFIECKHCQKRMEVGTSYCPRCGTKV